MSIDTTKDKNDSDDLVQFSSFYLDNTLCGINIAYVQEINEDLKITKVPLSPPYVEGIMNLRGQIVTVINQSMKIGVKPSVIGPTSRVIIVDSREESIGLLVDSVSEVVSVSQKAISDPPPNIQGVQGKFIEGVLRTSTHELMALLDIDKILAEE